MKKTLLLFIILLLILKISPAQITLQWSVPYGFLITVPLEYAGTKLVYVNTTANQMVLYNLNGTVYKTIDVPAQQFPSPYPLYLTETLFDTDSSTLEYALQVSDISSKTLRVRIYREDGTLLFSKDSAGFVSVMGTSINGGDSRSIFNSDSGTYMHLGVMGFPLPANTFVYKLPGSLYCAPCGYGGAGLADGNNDNYFGKESFNLNSFPNPAKHTTVVYYDFPEGIHEGTLNFYSLNGVLVKSFRVTDLFRYITVSTDDLQAGSYVYKIVANGNASEGRQMVIE
jgi:hypothetical protein